MARQKAAVAAAVRPNAYVMGGMDLVRPLGLAGIPCAAVARPGAAALYSRFCHKALTWPDFSEKPHELVHTLVGLAAGEPSPPALFYEEDAQLLTVSRHRDALARAFRFVIADRDLVEDLVDKARFQLLAERLRLPVPATRRIRPASTTPDDVGLPFPLVIKPLIRNHAWEAIAGEHKALLADTSEELRRLWPRLAAARLDLLAQELVAGPETRIESYHIYVDERGGIAGEFTGRKIRTFPVSCGHSTALEITDAADVMRLGRELTEKLDLRGIAKFDFKRGPDSRLHLLEINPRFNLWHHLGATAGVNLPALVYADLMGLPRPAVQRARAGARWFSLKDFGTARAVGIPTAQWLSWAIGAEAKSVLAWDDPMPFLRGGFARVLARSWTKEGGPAFVQLAKS